MSAAFDIVRDRIGDERGFTLSELLVAILIGSIVMTASMSLVIMSLNSSQRVSDKVQGLADGRLTVTQLQQRLNSVSCLASGEYSVNGTTNFRAANAIVYAGPTELVYFADISADNGATNVAGSVGFLPYLRYLNFDNGATARVAGRQTRLVDGWRIPSTTTAPFAYSLLPGLTTPIDFTSMALSSNVTKAPPTNQRVMTELITNAVTTPAGTSMPFFQYFKGPTAEIVPSGTNPYIPYDSLENINHIRVNFRMIADSGRDQARGTTAGQPADNRTTQFSDDIYMRTSAGDCAAF